MLPPPLLPFYVSKLKTRDEAIFRYSGLKIYYSRYAGEYRRDRDFGHLKPSVHMEKLTATETRGDVVITYLNGKQRPPALEGLWGLKSALNLGLYK